MDKVNDHTASDGNSRVDQRHAQSTIRHAVLITAYKNPQQIVDIVNYLNEGFEFYIHVDKKSKMDTRSFEDIPNVHVFRRYIVNWGSIDHLRSILMLSHEALADRRNKYFHLITGQDFPVKSCDYILNTLDTENDYLEYFSLPSTHWRDRGGMDRLEYYNLYELFDHQTYAGRVIIKLIRMTQKFLGIRRQLPTDIFPSLFGGSTYWSLTRDSLQYVIDFTGKHPRAMECMKYTFCSEEIYFQTVLLNARDHRKIVNDNLRYIDWSPQRLGNPAFLDNTDYEKIIASNKLFARKFHEELSEDLKKQLMHTQREEGKSEKTTLAF